MPMCDDQRKAGGGSEFVPHMTICHYASRAEAEEAKARLEASDEWRPTTFRVADAAVHVMLRQGDSGQFERCATVALGPGAAAAPRLAPPGRFVGMPLEEEEGARGADGGEEGAVRPARRRAARRAAAQPAAEPGGARGGAQPLARADCGDSAAEGGEEGAGGLLEVVIVGTDRQPRARALRVLNGSQVCRWRRVALAAARRILSRSSSTGDPRPSALARGHRRRARGDLPGGLSPS